MGSVNYISIYDYDDYRVYASHRFTELKRANPRFSLGVVAARVGMSKMGVKYVLDQKRHLADARLVTFAQSLGLTPEHTSYFQALGRFNQAKTDHERSRYLQQIFTLKTSPLPDAVPPQVGCFRRWYYPVICEMSYLANFREDPDWIRARLQAKVPRPEVVTALAYLRAHGLLKGSKAVASKIKIPDGFVSHVYKAYVAEQLGITKAITAQQARDDRELFTISISVNEEKFAVAKTMVAEFRHKLHDVLAGVEPCTRVIQINMQLYTAAIDGDVKGDAL